MKKLQVQKEGLSTKDKQLLENLLEENKDLKKRLENLEVIALEGSTIALDNPSLKEKELQNQINYLADEIKKLKDSQNPTAPES
ncbi:hypothetical protein [Rapidithrix thailandica]